MRLIGANEVPSLTQGRVAELVTRAAAELSMPPVEVSWWLRETNAEPWVFALDDWREQFESVTAAQERHWVEQDARVAVGVFSRQDHAARVAGPVALARMTPEQRLKCIGDKKLTKIANVYSGDVGLLLLGISGVGKTSAIAHAVVRLVTTARKTTRDQSRAAGDDYAFAKHAKRPVWTRALALDVRKTQWDMTDGFVAQLELMESAPLLVIDDLGHEQASDAIVHLLHCRYDAGLPTAVTSGFQLPELEQRYGQALVRRILGPSGMTVSCFARGRS